MGEIFGGDRLDWMVRADLDGWSDLRSIRVRTNVTSSSRDIRSVSVLVIGPGSIFQLLIKGQ